MDVKQRLRAYLDLSETLKVTDGPVPIMQAALEEIERLERGAAPMAREGFTDLQIGQLKMIVREMVRLEGESGFTGRQLEQLRKLNR